MQGMDEPKTGTAATTGDSDDDEGEEDKEGDDYDDDGTRAAQKQKSSQEDTAMEEELLKEAGADPSRVLGSSTQRTSRLRGRDAYRRFKRCGGRLRELVESFAVPACDFGDSIRHGFLAVPPASPTEHVEDVALGILDYFKLKSVNEVKRGISIILAQVGGWVTVLVV